MSNIPANLDRGQLAYALPVPPPAAESDEQIISLWLHGRSVHTQRAYKTDTARFLAFAGVPLARVTLRHVQAFADSLVGLVDASRARKIAAVKSLLKFAHRLGYLPFDVGAPVKLPAIKNTLAERILPEADVQRILALEPDRRNRALLRLLYLAGLRVSELCGLTGRDLQPRGEAGQVTVYGKGGKTRTVLLPESVWRELGAFREAAGQNGPLFLSRKHGALDSSQVLRIVRSAAKRAEIDLRVSPHWLRHAHASHALDRGAPIHLVQQTLGHSSVATTGRYLHARPGDSSARFLVG